MKRWNAPQIEEISDVLFGGGVVLLPTDTIYGIHASATNEDAVERILRLKAREAMKPLLVIAASAEEFRRLGVTVPPAASIEGVWPGPVTLILPLLKPIAASRNEVTLGCRVPDLPWLRALLERTGPLASTSANRAGSPPAETVDEIPDEWRQELDGILDLGRVSQAPSVIFNLTGDTPQLVREGEPVFTQKVWKTLRK